MTTTARPESFQIVGEQVAATLADARLALETYADGEADPKLLQKCAEDLHSARGALQLLEVYGASLLAEEMELACQFLEEGVKSGALTNEAIEALSRAMVQLPAYIDRVMGGLDFSKIESGHLSLEVRTFNLVTMLRELVGLFFNEATQKGIVLNVEIGEDVTRMVDGDETRIRQILTNLLANAVKFTEKGPNEDASHEAELSLCSRRQHRHELRLGQDRALAKE